MKPIKIISIDTEFTDFVNTQLISLGAVVEGFEREFYVEILDYNKKASSQFVKAVVEPQLDQNKYGKLKSKAKLALRNWFKELPEEFTYVILIDYIGDWELMLDLLENQLPDNVAKNPIYLVLALDSKAKSKAIERSMEDVSWFCDKTIQTFYTGFTEYFKLYPKPEQHHALADANANLYGWTAAMYFIEKHY